MKKGLIIVESPTKERALKEMIGDNFLIVSSKGHIKDLPKSRMGIDIENNFEPTWVMIPGKRQVIQNIKNIANGKENILLATDPDREGEAISWHIAQELDIENKKCRITFNEITKNVVTHSIENPRELDMNLINSQIARRLLDRLVGYKVSPLCYKYTKGKSAGRVQSVAVHLIVKKEREIESFVSEEYWKINVTLSKEINTEKNSFQALLITKDGIKLEIKNEEEADLHCKTLNSSIFFVSQIDTIKEHKHPPLPLKTSTLQQKAFNQLNFSVKKTMHIAQQLYEGIPVANKGTLGLITYMRTDSTRLSDEAKSNARQFIYDKYGKNYLSDKIKISKKKKIATKIQDAHEAIRPTSIDLEPESIKSSLTPDQFKLYSLIWKYFIASQMKSALFERKNIKIRASEYMFEANGSTIIFDGYLKILSDDIKDVESVILPELHEKENLKLLKIEPKQFFTKPPARYNEASLVKVLEKEGIGRPSTYVSIIDKILSRGYVEKENKRLLPTKLGISVDNFLMEYFSDIINVKFTAKMESELDKIESNDSNWQNILNIFYEPLSNNIEKLLNNPPTDSMFKSKDLTNEKCMNCGSPMEIKNGPYGRYLACSNNPHEHPTKPFLLKIGIPCPIHACGGEIVKLKSKKGKNFYGCSKYPACNFFSAFIPIDKKCPKCNSILIKINNKKKDILYKCSNKECTYFEGFSKNE